MYDDTLSALNAYSDGMAFTAHNIANSNTPDFRSRAYSYAGDFSGSVKAWQDPGNAPLNNGDWVSLSGLGDDALASMYYGGMNNTVDAGRETVNMIIAQRGFEANAAAIMARSENDATTLGLIADYRA